MPFMRAPNCATGPRCEVYRISIVTCRRAQCQSRLQYRRSDSRSRTSMAADIFAKLGDIKGESIDDKHKDEIEVLSFSWGVLHPQASAGAGGGGGAQGKTTFHDLSIVHKIDKASPVLMQACATGTHLKDATITQRK